MHFGTGGTFVVSVYCVVVYTSNGTSLRGTVQLLVVVGHSIACPLCERANISCTGEVTLEV